jgi:hypothetical protein
MTEESDMRTGWIASVAGAVGLCLGVGALAPPSTLAQAPGAVEQRKAHIRRCARADTLFGRLWRSHASLVTYAYAAARDRGEVRPPVRTASWETTSSRLVGTGAVIRFRGRDPKGDSARVELDLRFLDTLYRAPEQATVDLTLDDSVHLVLQNPHVDYPDVRVRGVPVVVTVVLTPSQSYELARAKKVTGVMGGYPFFLYDWEIWDINAIYRATVCGLE